jgi:hypothetical protein
MFFVFIDSLNLHIFILESVFQLPQHKVFEF